jgi:hypothetical protein
MTAIAGVVHGGKVYLGGDSAGVGGWALTVRADAKVFRNGPMVMGFTSSFRMGQVLRYAFTPPPFPENGDLDRYMVVDFIDGVRTALKTAGFATVDKGAEAGGTFLVGFHGRLFEINDDYQVGIPADGYAAVGVGQDAALGALYATPKLLPRKRLRLALEASEHFSVGVRGPFMVVREP